MRKPCQSFSHTPRLVSYWVLTVSMATSVLQFCLVKIVLPLTSKPLQLHMSHKDMEKLKLIAV